MHKVLEPSISNHIQCSLLKHASNVTSDRCCIGQSDHVFARSLAILSKLQSDQHLHLVKQLDDNGDTYIWLTVSDHQLNILVNQKSCFYNVCTLMRPKWCERRFIKMYVCTAQELLMLQLCQFIMTCMEQAVNQRQRRGWYINKFSHATLFLFLFFSSFGRSLFFVSENELQ